MNTDKKTEVRSTEEALSTERALKLALEALEGYATAYSDGDEAITAIRAALDAPCEALAESRSDEEQPASKPWVGLTNQELIDLTAIYSGAPLYCAIEAKLKEKNT